MSKVTHIVDRNRAHISAIVSAEPLETGMALYLDCGHTLYRPRSDRSFRANHAACAVCPPREEGSDDEQVIRIIDASDGWQKAYLCPACRHELGSDLQCSNCRRARAFGLWLSHEIERWTQPIQNDDGGADMFETHWQGA